MSLSNTIITIKKKSNQNLQFVINVEDRTTFNDDRLKLTVKNHYNGVLGARCSVELIPIGGGYTDIKVVIPEEKEPRILTWSFDLTRPLL